MHDFGRRAPRFFSNWFAAMVRLNRLGFKAQPLMLSNGRVYLRVENQDALAVLGESPRPVSGSRRTWLIAGLALCLVAALVSSSLLLEQKGPPSRPKETATSAPKVISPSPAQVKCQPVLGQLLTGFLDAHPSIRVDRDIVLGQLRSVKVSGECAGAELQADLYLSSGPDGWLIEKVTQPFDRVTSSNAN
jgi:hypothetical protein